MEGKKFLSPRGMVLCGALLLAAGALLCGTMLFFGSFFIWDFTVEGNVRVSE